MVNNFGMQVRNGNVLYGAMSTQAIPIRATPIIPFITLPIIYTNATAPPIQLTNSIAEFMASNAVNQTITMPLPISAPIVPVRRPSEPRPLTQDTLNLTEFNISNGLFTPKSNSGISRLRPEIIALYEFQNIYDPTGYFLTAAGKTIFLNWQMRKLRENSLNQLFTGMTQSNNSLQLLDQSLSGYRTALSDAESKLRFLNSSVQQLELMKQTFEIKTLDNSFFDTKNFLTLNNFLQKKMLFPAQNIAMFSDTKILYQLVFDARSMAETYSISFVNSSDNDRISDTDPIKIDTTYGNKSSFDFSPSLISGKYGFKEADFFSFDSSLPIDMEDRIKILTLFLSKELRISNGLHKKSVQTILGNYYGGSPSGNPFDNIFGTVGNDIFEAPFGNNSLSSLMYITNAGATVLPFERKFISDQQTSYIPGTQYFIDSILSLTKAGAYNTEPLNNFSQKCSEVVANAKKIIYDLFSFDTTSNLLPEKFIKFIFGSIRDSLTSLKTNQKSNKNQLLSLALFSMASQDKQLRFMLFQFLLLLGLSTNNPLNQKKLFERLAIEVREVYNLSFVRAGLNNPPSLTKGANELYPYLEQLATDIEAKIKTIIAASQTPSTKQTFLQKPAENSITEQQGTLLTQDISFVIPSENKGAKASIANSQEILIPFQNGEIKTALLNASFANDKSVPTLIRNFIDVAYQIDNMAENYTLSIGEEVQRTFSRFNLISTTNIILSLYEIFISLTNKFFVCSMKTIKGTMNISVEPGKNEFSLNAIDLLIPKPSNTLVPIIIPVNILLNSSAGVPKNSVSIATPPLPSVWFGGSNTSPGSNNMSSGKTESSISDPSVNAISPQTKGVITTATKNSESPTEITRALIANQPLLAAYGHIQNSMNSIVEKLTSEENTLKNILHIFDVICSNITRNKDRLLQYLSRVTAEQKNILNQNMSIQQIQTNSWILSDIKENHSRFGIKESIDSEWKALTLLMAEPQYSGILSSKRTKLLVVGIPNGFSKNLFESIHRSSGGSKFEKENEVDAITINVYKKSMEDDDIVFLPKNFMFDLSLYPAGKETISNAVATNMSFKQLLPSMKLIDFSITNSPNALANTLVSYTQFLNDAKREFISNENKKDMFKNHIVSNLLKTYIKGMCGFNFSEETFPNVQYRTQYPSSISNELLRTFLMEKHSLTQEQANSFGGETFFSDQTISDFIKDDIRLLQTARSMTPELVQEKILTEKKFERVFIIPIDIDSFTIDRRITTSSFLGRAALNSNAFASRILNSADNNQTLYKDRSKEPNALIMEEFFVTVESTS